MKLSLRKFWLLFVAALVSTVLVAGWLRVDAIVPATSTPPASESQPNSAQFSEKVIAQLDGFKEMISFDPATDGYRFQNYGGQPPNIRYDEIVNSSVLIGLFGTEGVCEDAPNESSGECPLTTPAQIWRNKQIETLDEGRCEGMAVSSLLFWLKAKGLLNYPGFESPAELTKGKAQTVAQLDKDRIETQYYIAYFHLMQRLDEVATPARESRKLPPSQIVQKLVEGLQKKSPYTIGIYQKKEGRLTAGHTLAPFAVSQMKDGTYHVSVYDSNLPGETPFITIDPRTETWQYTTKIDGKAFEYQGDQSTQNLDIVPVLARTKEFACPFCNTTGNQSASKIEFTLIGEGAMSIFRQVDGKETGTIGYIPATGQEPAQYFNDIPDAEIHDFRGGLGEDVAPTYVVPGGDAKSEVIYGVGVYGKYLNESDVNADLIMVGDGFVVGVEGLALNADNVLGMGFAVDGLTMAFNPSEDTSVKNIFFAVDDTDPEQGSYIFDVGGIDFRKEQIVKLSLDLENLQFRYENDKGEADTFRLTLTYLDGNGNPYTFEPEEEISVDGGQQGLVDFEEPKGSEVFYEVTDQNSNSDTQSPTRGKAKPGVKPQYQQPTKN